jgi:hypothetical protein
MATTIDSPDLLTGHEDWPARAGPSRSQVSAVIGRDGTQRAAAALSLTADVLACYPRIPLAEAHLSDLNRRLPCLIDEASGQERAALLALAAALSGEADHEVRAALRRADHPADGSYSSASLGLATAAHVTALLADGYRISQAQLSDLAALIGSPAAVQVISRTGPLSLRAMTLVLAIARDEPQPDASLPGSDQDV